MDKITKNLFNNTELAFTNKSNFELRKAFFLFSVLDFPILTKIGNAFLLLVLKLRLPFKTIIKNTIFNHFCGGETINDCKSTFRSLKNSILALCLNILLRLSLLLRDLKII